MSETTEIIRRQRLFYASGTTRALSFRMEQLKRLYAAIKAREGEILEALRLDLNKPPFEAYETELGMVYEELRNTLGHLRGWARPQRVRPSLLHFPSSGRVYREPYGVVLILSPWNYPFQLTMVPLIGAIAAGNCAVLKPSEYSPHTSGVLERLVREVFPPAYVSLVNGGREASRHLLEGEFDYIFFTGSPAVGRVVMEAASKHLTPVTLELGGKSPCIVDGTARLRLAARRIAWGKFLNAGQTCIAPDYLLVHTSVKEKLVQELKGSIRLFYGDHPEASEDFPKIIHHRHFTRLLHLMEEGRILAGGGVREETRQIAPTLIDEISWDSPIMQEEIFGPLLPILSFDRLEDALSAINRRPKPLALYLFTTSRENQRQTVQTVSFGGGCINDTIIHIANTRLPFGGVGGSGMGQYHGRASFDTFSHRKSVVKKSNLADIPLRYPPYKNHLGLLKRLMR